MKSKQDRSRDKAKIHLQNVTEEHEVIRLEYSSLLSSLLHVNHSHHNCCPLSKFQPPILSGILPLSDETIVRIAIGSHREIKNKDGFVTRHNSTLVDVLIPPQYLLLFYYEGLLHAGGPGTMQCERMFTIFGPKTRYASLQNKNYSGNISICEGDCVVCKILKTKKEMTGNIALPESFLDSKETPLGTTLYDYTLWEDGFCVLKVADKTCPKEQLQEFIRSKTFNSMKQEEDGEDGEVHLDGERCMLDKGAALTSDEYLRKKLHNDVQEYIQGCYDITTSFLKKITKVNYEMKGHTMLLNKGRVGYQTLHMDDENKCSCVELKL